jgi:hypothetical protein
LLDRFAVLSGSFRVRLRLDHALREKWQDQCKLLFALSLPAKDSATLLIPVYRDEESKYQFHSLLKLNEA